MGGVVDVRKRMLGKNARYKILRVVLEGTETGSAW